MHLCISTCLSNEKLTLEIGSTTTIEQLLDQTAKLLGKERSEIDEATVTVVSFCKAPIYWSPSSLPSSSLSSSSASEEGRKKFYASVAITTLALVEGSSLLFKWPMKYVLRSHAEKEDEDEKDSTSKKKEAHQKRKTKAKIKKKLCYLMKKKHGKA
eukprot:TRINITY_DN892_c0_g1_i8.p1 TRINITY_DN892_c0_g1~~TRINITY_DN892_c0_g1_i8.p1  ORF type:complete len:156 (+),score=58.93 TRINITY_DN892_c0_g1_i8:8-475(+)